MIFKLLYDNEINFTISTFWDAGYTVKLGDELNGFMDSSTGLPTIDDAINELMTMAMRHYPELMKNLS